MRLVKRGQVRFEDSGHGEVPVPDVAGELEAIRVPFLHFPFSKGIDDWIKRHLKYAEREALKELEQTEPLQLTNIWGNREKRRATLRGLSRRLPFRPLLRFSYQYFWKWGFLDGRYGWTFSRLMAFYEGLIVLKKKEKRLLSMGKNL